MTPFEEKAARLRDAKWDANADDGQSDAFMARYDRRILLRALDDLREGKRIADDVADDALYWVDQIGPRSVKRLVGRE